MTMNSKIVSTMAISIAIVFILAAPSLNNVFAKGDSQNGFGKAASELGKSGEMGKHSSNPDPSDSDHDTPRSGIGNVAKDNGCSVSQLGDLLSGKSDSC